VTGSLPLRLNSTLEPEAYRPVFKAHRRLHIPSILEPASATELHARITGSAEWTRSIHLGPGKDVDIRMDELEAMSPAERADLERSLLESGADSLSYIFDTVRITGALLAGRAVAEPVRAIHDFVNGQPFLDFITRLTGDERVAFAEVMATRYLPGHYATAHADELADQKRLYAYVLNLTPQWRADWGGVLMFLDEDGHVAEGYVPRFNALNVFAVPQTHAVSAVSRLARAPRLSITGWVHAA
jgi:Rps23 Pro-64 3,4-dihydroxylase Tpa1-like proline 4-hydroxylase